MPKTLICEAGNHPFTLEDEDIAAYEKFGAEPLPICFPHQHQWRLSFRNDRFLHKRKCDLTGADIVSMYPQDAPYKVYEREAWFSDKWDPMDFGRDFDFSKTFFEQYEQLQKEVPRMALVNVGSINSDYCNSCVYNKNSYLIFGGDRNEDSLYGDVPMYCKSCVDCDWTTYCELCYECRYSERCYGCRFTHNSKNCTDCAFMEDCTGCKNCILCFNLSNKSYCIENKQYSKEEYFAKKSELITGGFEKQQKLYKRFLELRKKRIVKYAHIVNAENSTGDYVINSKNCTNCFEVIGSEDCRDSYTIFINKDCFNADYIGTNSQFNFNSLSTDTAYRNFCSFWSVNSSDTEYSELSISSKNIFGSMGMRHQQYCILNKKYTEKEFWSLRERIIAHMEKTGELNRFFPKRLSTFPYNESTASFFYPLTKEQAIAQGFKWRDEKTQPVPQTYQIPDNIKDVPDAILEQTLACETTGKNFRIIPQELAFYRSQNIPIPRRHSDTRYRDRLALRNPFTIFDRSCGKCGATIKTTYSPDRPEIVYCEKCYLEAVY